MLKTSCFSYIRHNMGYYWFGNANYRVKPGRLQCKPTILQGYTVYEEREAKVRRDEERLRR